MKKIILASAMILIATSWASLVGAQNYDIRDYLTNDDQKTISMDFRDANLNEVLKIFSQQSGLNFIASSEVKSEPINLYLENVPVEEALERILSANDLTYELKPGSNIFTVKKILTPENELTTRVYQIQHATLPSSKLNKTLSAFSTSEDSGSGEGGGGAGKSGLLEGIKAILTGKGTVVEDIRTNSLIVTDIPSQFDLIERTIKRLDIRIPQILIEVEMLDISKNTADQLGAKFGSTPITFSGGEKDSIFPFNLDNIVDDNVSSKNPGDRDGLFEEPRYRVSTLSFAGLTFALQFLRSQTDTKNLARPRILTLNNETAQIQISTDEAIGLSSTTTASEGSSESVAEAERVETGVFLTVTPQASLITHDIVMAIEPRVVQANSGGTFNGQTFKDPEERGTKSILRVRDGDTIVMGGLLRSTEQTTKTKVPVLSKVPFVGMAFRHKEASERERELIIFITPHILKEDFNQPDHNGQKLTSQKREQSFSGDRFDAINEEMSILERKTF